MSEVNMVIGVIEYKRRAKNKHSVLTSSLVLVTAGVRVKSGRLTLPKKVTPEKERKKERTGLMDRDVFFSLSVPLSFSLSLYLD